MLNPYESFVSGQNPQEVIAATPDRLAQLATLPQRPPAPGKWDVREVLCHLADTEIAFAFRLRQSVAEDHHTIQPFDQDKWAIPYAAYDVGGALEVFRALRRWNLKFIGAQPAGMFERPVSHPERGQMTFQTVVETMAGHDLNHIKQIECLCSR